MIHWGAKIADSGRSPMSEWLEDHVLIIPTLLLSSENHPPHTWQPYLQTYLRLHSPAKLLSHLVVNLDDSEQGLKGEWMQIFLERMIWADPSLVFPSLLPSAGEG